METKKFTQFGTFSVLIILPMLIIFTKMMIKSGLKNRFLHCQGFL